MNDAFVVLKNNDELYEFARQYHMEVSSIENLRFPIEAYFDPQTGKPNFRGAPRPPLRVILYNEGDEYELETNDIAEILDFVRRKGRKKVKVGDFATLEKHLAIFPKLISFFSNIDYACRYAYGEMEAPVSSYKVLEIKNKIALVEDQNTKKCYLTETDNLVYGC